MSNYVTCGAVGCVSQPGVCLVAATQRDPNAGIEYTRNNRCSFIGLAISQLIFGICLIAIGIPAIVICNSTSGCGWPEYEDYYYAYYGVWTIMGTNIWGGALVVLFASFGLAQGCSPSRCTIGANFACSMVGIFVSLGLMSLELIAAIVSWTSVALIILHSIATGIDFLLFVLFIISASRAGAARGCCGGCCNPYAQREIVSLIPAGAQPHAVSLSNGQTVIMQGYPQVASNQSFRMQPPRYSTVLYEGQVAGATTSQSVVPMPGAINQTYVTDVPLKVALQT